MKKIIASITLIFLLFITLPGCYTVVWEPDMEFPNEDNSEYSQESYYDGNYYGDYNYFYNQPWWLSLNPPTKDGITIQRNKNGSTEALRNSGDGRNSGTGRNPGGVLDTPPPTRDGDSNNGGSTGSGNNGSGTNTTVDRETTNTTNTGTQRSTGSGNSSNPVRNNDGNRTSDGKKR